MKKKIFIIFFFFLCRNVEVSYCPIGIMRVGLYRDMALEREELYCKI